MRPQKKVLPSPSSDGLGAWRTALWLVVFGGTLFFWPACLDRYLAPRFFFLSGALLVSVFLVWKDLRERAEGRWHVFDLLLLGWYGLNLASVAWSHSGSEGIFYAQKTLLLFGTYWLVRQALLRDEGMVRQVLGQITRWLTGIVCLILFVQIRWAVAENGLDNETLYDFASGVFGNKSLAAEFLFFLLVFNLMFGVRRFTPQLPDPDFFGTKLSGSSVPPKHSPVMLAAICSILLLLILVLQVRTALVATVAGGVFYCAVRAILETGFRKTFLQKILPTGLLALGVLAGVLAWKGGGSSMAERLNPLNYLESATANERRFVWHKTDLLNADHYWLGVGNGSWKFWLPSKNIGGGYRLAEGNVVFTRAHNDYLEVRAEMGMVGAVWFCALFGVAFLMACIGDFSRRKAKSEATMLPIRAPAAKAAGTALAASAGLLGYCIIQYFDFPRERIEFQVVLGVLFAFLAHGARGLTFGENQTFRKLKTFGKFALTLALAFNLLIGWERMRGETHNVRLLDAQNRGDWRRVAAESALAENRFYEYTDAAMPLAWHEGVARFQMEQFEQSAAAFERAYRLNPWSFQVINNYASVLVKLGRFSEAVQLFEQALAINPRYDEGKFNLSFVYYQMADYPRAEEWLSRVDTIAKPSNNADREKNRAMLQRLGEFRKVLEEKRR
ncbi:MAG: O-antigen ligase family protein [Saprospiraceae bacterium]